MTLIEILKQWAAAAGTVHDATGKKPKEPGKPKKPPRDIGGPFGKLPGKIQDVKESAAGIKKKEEETKPKVGFKKSPWVKEKPAVPWYEKLLQ